MPMASLLVALGQMSVERLVRGPAGEGDDSYLQLIERVRARLEKLVMRTPTLIAIDDLQWADPATLLALRFLPEQLSDQPITWLLTRRAGEGEPAVGRLYSLLEEVMGSVRMRLGPLSDDAVNCVVGDLLGALPGPEVRGIAKAADGNPYALTELVEGLVEEGGIHIVNGTAGLVGGDAPEFGAYPCTVPVCLPRRFRNLVARQLQALEPQTRRLLEIAAVLGPTFTPDDVAAIIAEPAATLLPSLQEALAARLLTCTAEAVTFRHDMVWQGVLQSIPASLQRALHRQVADMLLRRRDSVAQAAMHLMYGARRGDSAAIEILNKAAEATLESSPHIAAKLAMRCLEIMEPLDPLRVPLGATATEALTRVGPLPSAIALARNILAKGPTDCCAVPLRLWLATALMLHGRATDAVTVAQELIGASCLATEMADHVQLVELLALSAFDHEAAGQRARRVLDEPAPRRNMHVSALLVLAKARWSEGRLAAGLNLVREAVIRAEDGWPTTWYDHPRLALAAMLTQLCEFAEAADALDSAQKDMSLVGAHLLNGQHSLLRSRLELAAGRSADAVATARGGIAMAYETGVPRYVPLGWRVLSTAALRRGDLAEAAQYTDRLRDALRAEGCAEMSAYLWMSAQIATANDEYPQALPAMAAIYQNPSAHSALLMEEPAAAAWLVRTALRTGRSDHAAAVTAVIERHAVENPELSSLAAAAVHARGLYYSDPSLLEQAVGAHSDLWASGSAAEDLAAVLVNSEKEKSITHLDYALSVYRSTDAARDVARLRRRLRNLGIRRRHWTYTKRPDMGWNSLTDTERCVAELVATGLTNRQVASRMFLSPHTVGFHLRQIFRKLGIRSRVELAYGSGAASQHDAVQTSVQS
nr:RebR-like transcriptional regulator [uncultured bacterium]